MCRFVIPVKTGIQERLDKKSVKNIERYGKTDLGD